MSKENPDVENTERPAADTEEKENETPENPADISPQTETPKTPDSTTETEEIGPRQRVKAKLKSWFSIEGNWGGRKEYEKNRKEMGKSRNIAAQTFELGENSFFKSVEIIKKAEDSIKKIKDFFELVKKEKKGLRIKIERAQDEAAQEINDQTQKGKQIGFENAGQTAKINLEPVNEAIVEEIMAENHPRIKKDDYQAREIAEKDDGSKEAAAATKKAQELKERWEKEAKESEENESGEFVNFSARAQEFMGLLNEIEEAQANSSAAREAAAKIENDGEKPTKSMEMTKRRLNLDMGPVEEE